MMNDNETIQLLTVGKREVEEMLDRYDSGMSDRTTQNAVALALKRILKPGIHIKVFYNGENGSCGCRIEESEFELPGVLANWLERAEHAKSVNPISFPVSLKNDWLMKLITSSEPLPQDAPQEPQAA